MSSLYINVITSVLIILIGVEIGSIAFPIVGRIGTIVWVFSFLLIAFEALHALYKIILNSVSKKSPLTIVVLSFFVVTVFAGAFNILNSNSEAAQEIGCTLTNFGSIDFGFRTTCLFGYPNRQLFIPALPSLLFGRGLVSLNLGSALVFVSGLIIYAYGLTRFFKRSIYNDAISAIIISSVFQFYYVNWFLFGYEQSILPLSFTLMATGLLLSLTHENFYKNLGLVGIVLAYLIFSYTTGLFFAFFIIMVLFYLLFFFTKAREQKNFIGSIIVGGIVLFLSSLLFRNDIHIAESGNSNVNILSDVVTGLTHLITRSSSIDYVNFTFQPFFIIALFAPFILKARKYYIFVFLWILAVFIFSIASKGYSYYSIDFRVHRAIVVVPILLVCFGAVLESIKKTFIKNFLFYFLVLIVLFTSAIIYQRGIIQSKINGERHRHVSFILWLKDKLNSSGLATEGSLIFDDELRNINNYSTNYASVQDSMRYYLPNLNMCSVSSCFPQGNTDSYYVKPYNGTSEAFGKKVLGVFDFNGDKVEVYKE